MAPLKISACKFLAKRLTANIRNITTLLLFRFFKVRVPARTVLVEKVDPRSLSEADIDLARCFFREYYPQTVFSAWMLEQPFLGLFEGKKLLAAGGVIIGNRNLRICNIGNFLTSPEFRGQGLAKTVARSLIEQLRREGMDTFTLGTAEENVPAWRAYESIGFRIVDSRPQIDLLSLS